MTLLSTVCTSSHHHHHQQNICLNCTERIKNMLERSRSLDYTALHFIKNRKPSEPQECLLFFSLQLHYSRFCIETSMLNKNINFTKVGLFFWKLLNVGVWFYNTWRLVFEYIPKWSMLIQLRSWIKTRGDSDAWFQTTYDDMTRMFVTSQHLWSQERRYNGGETAIGSQTKGWRVESRPFYQHARHGRACTATCAAKKEANKGG